MESPQKKSEESVRFISKSRLPIFIYALIIVILLGLGLFMLTKTDLGSSLSLFNYSDEHGKWKKQNLDSVSINYPTKLKAEKSETDPNGIIITTPQKDEVFEISSTTSVTAKNVGEKDSLEAAKKFGIERERLYYSEYKGTTVIDGREALVYSSASPKDPETQASLPPYKSYVIYEESKENGEAAVKITRISYFGNAANTEIFEKIVSTVKLD